MRTPLTRSVIVALAVLFVAAPSPARADITAFLGASLTPVRQPAAGLAVGFTILVAGVEFEYVRTAENLDEAAPGLQEGSASVFVQTPTGRVRLYGLLGAGLYREQLAGVTGDTSTSLHAGGGLKIALAGPVGVRLDYRIYTMRGREEDRQRQRVYAGVMIDF